MSYRKKHIKSKIHKIKPKYSIFKRPVFWILFLFLIIILFASYIFIFYSGLQVKNIIISGNEKTQSKALEKFVFDNIDKLISKNIFLVNSDNLTKQILEKFPIIEKLKIDKKLPQTLILGVEERKPFGVFCSNSLCFLIDENGVIFEPLLKISDNMLIVRKLLDSKQVFTGEEVVGQNIMKAISKIEKNLKDNFKIDIKEALISNPLKLDIKTAENWYLYFDLSPDSDINMQITKMNILLKDEIPENTRKNLKYIKLEYKDRAYILCVDEHKLPCEKY